MIGVPSWGSCTCPLADQLASLRNVLRSNLHQDIGAKRFKILTLNPRGQRETYNAELWNHRLGCSTLLIGSRSWLRFKAWAFQIALGGHRSSVTFRLRAPLQRSSAAYTSSSGSHAHNCWSGKAPLQGDLSEHRKRTNEKQQANLSYDSVWARSKSSSSQ